MRRPSALMCLSILVVGVPVLLLVVAGPPFVPHIDSAGIARALQSNYLSSEAVLRALGFIGWAVWSYLMLVLALEVVGRALGARNLRFSRTFLSVSRGVTPPFVRKLIEVAIGGAFLASAISPAAIVASRPHQANGQVLAATADPRPAHSVASGKTSPSHQIGSYEVRAGDCLWRIAGTELGDPTRWPEIFHLNKGRQFSDGRALVNPNLIHPGWMLDLPDVRDEVSPPSLAVHPGIPTDSGGIIQGSKQSPDSWDRSQSPDDLTDTDYSLDETEQSPPAVIVLPSGSALAGSFVAGMLAAHALAKLRQQRRRRVSDSDFGTEQPLPSKFVADLVRAWVSPNLSELDGQGELVLHEWVNETGSWPTFLVAIEKSGRMTFELQSSSSETTPRGSHRVQFARRGSHLIAETKGQLVPMLKRKMPFERELFVAIGATEGAQVVHLGFLSAGVISVNGSKAETFVQQVAVSFCAGGPQDSLDLRLLGVSPSFAAFTDLPHVQSVSDWSEDALADLEAELLSRERLRMEATTDDLRVHVATHSEAWASVLIVATTEPPVHLRERVDQIAVRLPQLGGIFIAIGWKPNSSRAKIEVGDRIEHDLDLDTVSGPLWPLLLSETEVTEAIDLVRAAHEEVWGGQELKRQGEAPQVAELASAKLESPSELTATVDEEPAARDTHLGDDANEASAAPPFIEIATAPEAAAAPEKEAVDDPPSGILEVRCFGALAVSRNNRNYAKWRENARELLAFLVSHPASTKDALVDELIPNFDDLKAAEKELSRRASQVRTKVSQMGERAAYLIRDGDTFRVDREKIWSDIWVFDTLLTEADKADTEESISLLDRATLLYRGEFCSDCYFGPWVEAVRTKYRERFARASMRLCDLLLEKEEVERALSAIDRAIEFDRVNEELHRKGIYIEGAVLGRASWARKRFQDLKTILRDELDEAPNSETQQLMMSIEKRAKGAR